jgi:hypothetical protein
MAPGAASWAKASPSTNGSRCGSSTTAWTIPAALASRKGIGSSPPSPTPSAPRRPSCRHCIGSGGRWRPRWTSSRPTSAALGGAAQQDPDGVRQELWAHLLVHDAIRTLIHQAALDAEVDPDRLSFPRSLHIARRQVTSQAAFPPRRLARATRQAAAEALRHLLPPRRLRAWPPVVKRKMSNFALKRDPHRHWPQPTRPPGQAVVIVARTARGP